MTTARAVLTAAVLLSCLLTAAARLEAATSGIRVTTTHDDTIANGNCTLREAIIAANTDAPVDRCPAGAGEDRIILREGLYLLSLTGSDEDAARTGDLDITAPVTIQGAGAGVTTIDGGSDEDYGDRVFHVAAGVGAALFDMTIQGGLCSVAGGILNRGTLTVADSVLRHNLARDIADCSTGAGGGGGGIYNTGELYVLRSKLSENAVHGIDASDVAFGGGGLRNHGSAVVRDTLISNNYSGGGAIWNDGTLDVTDSEISNNEARFWGAGLLNVRGRTVLTRTTVSGNVDGGILNSSTEATLVLRNSTVSGNTSLRVPGAISGGSVEIVGSTVAGNHSFAFAPCPDGPPCLLPVAGIEAQAYLANTIVSNPGYRDCSTAVISAGHNIDSDGSCGLNAPGDLPAVDPLLGPLADNGGRTRTHALDAESPAVDRIPAESCRFATDQRGVARPDPLKVGGCDIGAYEFSPAGEIGAIIAGVQALYRVLTPEEALALLDPLKEATIDVRGGHLPAACEMLGVFAETLAGYVDAGILDAETAQPLFTAAARVQSLICG